jgi:chromate transport protein ChrA
MPTIFTTWRDKVRSALKRPPPAPQPAPVAQPKTTQPLAPAPAVASPDDIQVVPTQTAVDGQVVSGYFVDATGNKLLAEPRFIARIEQHRKTVEEYSDEASSWAEGAVVKFCLTVCYLLPPVVAWFVGEMIGAKLAGGPFTLIDPFRATMYILSVGVELSISFLTLAMARVLRRMQTDRRQITVLVGLAVIALLLVAGSSFAQWLVYDSKIAITSLSAALLVGVRTVFSPLIDIGALVAIPVLSRKKTLKQHIADMQTKAEGVAHLVEAEIGIARQEQYEIQRQQDAEVEAERKAKREHFWTEKDRLEIERMLEAERNKSNRRNYY